MHKTSSKLRSMLNAEIISVHCSNVHVSNLHSVCKYSDCTLTKLLVSDTTFKLIFET